MTYKTLCEAIEEAERFLKKAKRSKAAAVQFTPENPKIKPWMTLASPVDDAATKRASMDLTRALAKLRK